MIDANERERLAATALASALRNDPFYVAITVDFEADETARHAILTEYCRYSLHEGYQIGTVVVLEDEPHGGAIWILPQPSEVTQQAAAAKHAAFATLLGPRGFDNYRAILAFMEPSAQTVIPVNTWYLSILGVAPQQQGRGLGRALLEPTLRQADRNRSCCFLETFNSTTLRFYSRFGFSEVAKHVEPITDSCYWIMLREPQFSDAPRRAAG